MHAYIHAHIRHTQVAKVTEMVLRGVCMLAPWAPLGPPEDPEAGMAPHEAKAYRDSPHNYVG